MPNPIKPKRSYTPNSVPTANDLQAHELAINWNDAKAFTKDASGNIVTVNLGGSGGGGISWVTAPASPTSAGTAGQVAYDGSYYYICTAASTWRRVAVSSWSDDPYVAYLSLLLHMDGTTTTFVDSASGKTVTAYGQATQVSTQSKFGGKSCEFDGSGDYLTVSGIGNIAAADFVLEWYMRVADVSAYQHIIGTSTNGNFMVALLAPYNGAGAIGVGRNNVAWDFVRNASLSNNTWHYVAISRDSGTMRLYVDGSIVGSSASNSQSYSIDTLQIGAQASGSTGSFGGHLDDLRLTIGSSRGYTGSTITVPTAAFPNP